MGGYASKKDNFLNLFRTVQDKYNNIINRIYETSNLFGLTQTVPVLNKKQAAYLKKNKISPVNTAHFLLADITKEKMMVSIEKQGISGVEFNEYSYFTTSLKEMLGLKGDGLESSFINTIAIANKNVTRDELLKVRNMMDPNDYMLLCNYTVDIDCMVDAVGVGVDMHNAHSLGPFLKNKNYLLSELFNKLDQRTIFRDRLEKVDPDSKLAEDLESLVEAIAVWMAVHV